MDALWGAEFFDAEDAEPQTDAPAEENNPHLSCRAFCRYFRSGKGYPGEYVYYCCAAGNEHIIDVDFIESEII